VILDNYTFCQGTVTLTASATGKLSAKAVRDGVAYSFSMPPWAKTPGAFSSVTTTRQGTLTVNVSSSGEVTGQLTLAGVNGTFTVLFYRQLSLTAPDLYTVILEKKNTVGRGPVADIPSGLGYLGLTLSAKGAVKGAGKLPDGTAVSFSSAVLDADGRFLIPCSLPLYAKRGGVHALLTFFPAAGIIRNTGAADFPGEWYYPGKSAALTDDAFLLDIDVLGYAYDKRLTVESGQLVMANPYSGDPLLVSVPFSISNGRVTLPAKTGNPYGVTLAVVQNTGVGKGKFTVIPPSGTRSQNVSYEMMFIKTDGKVYGYGYSLVVEKIGDYAIKHSRPVYTVE
jgi:hypothetical protein